MLYYVSIIFPSLLLLLYAMSTLNIGNDWESIKSKLKRRYVHLTENDLAFSAGEEKQLIERLSKRLLTNSAYVINLITKLQRNTTTNRL